MIIANTPIVTHTLIVSDFEIGSGMCRAADALSFLKAAQFERLIFNGDFFQAEEKFTDEEMTLIQFIRQLMKEREVVFVDGNHDPIDSELIWRLFGVHPVTGYNWKMDGKKLYATHGHRRFETLYRLFSHPWIDKLVNRYDPGMKPGSPKWKIAWKKTIKKFFSDRLMRAAMQFANRTGLHGLIVGHSHHPLKITEGKTTVFNSGSWVLGEEAACVHVGPDAQGYLHIVDKQAPE